MPLTTRPVRDGETVSFMEYEGFKVPEVWFGSFLPGGDLDAHMKNLKDLAMRPDDVLICTFPKSGTHWIWEIVSMLLSGRAEYEKKPKESLMFEFQSIETLSSAPSPRIFNTHFSCRSMPTAVIKNKCKVIHVERNPKDMAVSLYHHVKTDTGDAIFGDSFSTTLPYMTGQYGYYLFYPWFQYVQEFDEFTKEHPDLILNLRYEDMKKDPVEAVTKVARFLDVACTDDLATTIADKCDFKKMKQADIDIKEGITLASGYLGKDTKAYRKGEVGDWKNWFTVAENEQFDQWLTENMKPRDIVFSL